MVVAVKLKPTGRQKEVHSTSGFLARYTTKFKAKVVATTITIDLCCSICYMQFCGHARKFGTSHRYMIYDHRSGMARCECLLVLLSIKAGCFTIIIINMQKITWSLLLYFAKLTGFFAVCSYYISDIFLYIIISIIIINIVTLFLATSFIIFIR